MSAIASRSSYRVADEQEWLESSVNADPSPASVWAPDYDEEDETTLQGRRVDTQPTYLMSPNIEREESVVNAPRQVRMLDESQVLAGEASFATVRLNQPFEESVLKPQPYCEPIPISSEDNRVGQSAGRVPLLDESKVLSGEASFATVIGKLGKAQRHSPITEFLVKTKLSFKQLVLAVVALVSMLALAVIVLLIMTRTEVVTVSATPPPTIPATSSQSVSTQTESSESVSNSPSNLSGNTSPTQVAATVAEKPVVAETKSIERSSAEESHKAPAEDAKSGTVSQENVSEAKDRVVETKKQSASDLRKAAKQLAATKTPNATVRSQPRETRPEPTTPRQSEVPVRVENVETKASPITGGGERPRTVTRKP